ncbi:MAG TPA: hypothetical protein DCM14_03005 [Clostridiales bacterium UBA8153]|nr:hypothetical protein [Clostridiales bacterium UBA8153]
MAGATTRRFEEIPPAIRSRCVEVACRQLTPGEVPVNAAAKISAELQREAVDVNQRSAANGREAVNPIQLATGLVLTASSKTTSAAMME